MHAPDQKNVCSEGFTYQCNLATSNCTNCGCLYRNRYRLNPSTVMLLLLFFWNLIPCSYFWDYLFLVVHTVLSNIAGLNSSISIWQMLKISWGQDTIRGICPSDQYAINTDQHRSALLACAAPSPQAQALELWDLLLGCLLSSGVTIRCPHHTHIKLHIPTKKY